MKRRNKKIMQFNSYNSKYNNSINRINSLINNYRKLKLKMRDLILRFSKIIILNEILRRRKSLFKNKRLEIRERMIKSLQN